MEYTVVKGHAIGDLSLGHFIDKVNEYISKGWKPQGGIIISGRFFLQAMIKE